MLANDVNKQCKKDDNTFRKGKCNKSISNNTKNCVSCQTDLIQC